MVPPPIERGDVDVHVPDGLDPVPALGRATVVGVVAHPDDLELLVPGLVGACRDDPSAWFAGIVCTDGAGSTRGPSTAALSAAELVATRRAEQRRAADLGRYAAVVQLGRPSPEVREPSGRAALVDDLEALLRACAAGLVVTHDPTDRHATHQAVALAAVEACRRLPAAARPGRLLGVEGWRGLDWLPEGDRVALDVSGQAELAGRLAAVHASQLEAKRYDLALEGRRRAHATLAEQRRPDEAEQLSLAMDLSPLLDDPDLDPTAFVLGAVDRFRAEVAASLGRLTGRAGPSVS